MLGAGVRERSRHGPVGLAQEQKDDGTDCGGDQFAPEIGMTRGASVRNSNRRNAEPADDQMAQAIVAVI